MRENLLYRAEKSQRRCILFMKASTTRQKAIKRTSMITISYRKLWHMLIDKDVTKSDLQKSARLSWGTISRMNRGENIGTDILLRICETLQCDIVDIVEINSTTTSEDNQ